MVRLSSLFRDVLKVLIPQRLKSKLRNNKYFWQYRHVFDREWSKQYFANVCPARVSFYSKLVNEKGMRTVFEFGCASGPNLFEILSRVPQTKVFGYDISKPAIQQAIHRFREFDGRAIFYEKLDVNTFRKDVGESSRVDLAVFDRVLLYLSDKELLQHFASFSPLYERVLIDDFFGKDIGSYRHREYQKILKDFGFEVENNHESEYSKLGMEGNVARRVLFKRHV